jgi:ketosteroid isomerase-like protein
MDEPSPAADAARSPGPTTDADRRTRVERWVADYETAWRTAGTEPVRDLFTPDATYLPSPWATRVDGIEAIVRFWDKGRDGPDEEFTMTTEVVAADATTGVVRAQVDYADGNRWRDLWVIRFADDGRCRAFEEWPFSPDQPDGHS